MIAVIFWDGIRLIGIGLTLVLIVVVGLVVAVQGMVERWKGRSKGSKT